MFHSRSESLSQPGTRLAAVYPWPGAAARPSLWAAMEPRIRSGGSASHEASPPAPHLLARPRWPGWQRSGAFRGNSWPLPPASPLPPGAARTALRGRGGRERGGRGPRAGLRRGHKGPTALRGRQHPIGDQNNAGATGLPAPLPARGASFHPRTPPKPPRRPRDEETRLT